MCSVSTYHFCIEFRTFHIIAHDLKSDINPGCFDTATQNKFRNRKETLTINTQNFMAHFGKQKLSIVIHYAVYEFSILVIAYTSY